MLLNIAICGKISIIKISFKYTKFLYCLKVKTNEMNPQVHCHFYSKIDFNWIILQRLYAINFILGLKRLN